MNLRFFVVLDMFYFPKNERNKLAAKSSLCVFLGYGLKQKGY